MAETSRIALLRQVLLCLAIFANPAFAAGSGNGQKTDAANSPVDQFIVQYRKASPERGNAAARRAMLAEAGRRTGVTLTHTRGLGIGASVVRVDRALGPAEVDELLARLRAHPHVEFAHVDGWMGARQSTGAAAPSERAAVTGQVARNTATTAPRKVRPAAAPNDLLYPQQWSLFEATAGINAPAAWEKATGIGEVVAVLSTGITVHSDLAGNLVEGYDFVSGEPPFSGVGDGDGRDADPTDPGTCTNEGVFPGTSLAGVVVAQANNAKGIAGVAFDAKVQPIRVRSGCGTRASDLADAIVWASGGSVPGMPANPTPAKTLIVNAGKMLTYCIPSTAQAVRAANANGASVIASDQGYEQYTCAGIVLVSSLARNGGTVAIAESRSDVAAPSGESLEPVTSTTNTGNGGVGTEGYGPAPSPGTAGAHVAGIAALVQSLSQSPLPPGAVRDLLTRTSRYRGCDGCSVVDAGNAVNISTLKLLGMKGPVDVSEGSGEQVATFTVTLNRPSAVPVTFDFATVDGTAMAGSDYEAVVLPGQTIPAGQLSLSFDVVIHGDAIGEFEETFSAVATNVVGAVAMGATARAMIVDDDGPVPIHRGESVLITAGPMANRQFRFDVPANARSVSVVVPAFTSFTFSSGVEEEKYCYYGRYGWESSYCVIDAPQATTYYITITEDGYTDLEVFANYYDPATLSVADASITEGDGGTRLLTFTATLSQTYGAQVTFDVTTANGSASAGPDFVALDALEVTIPEGQLSKTFSVTVNGDTMVEPTEYLHVNLADAIGANLADAQAIGYIVNNDGPLLSVNDIAVGEGNAGTKVMTFSVSLSKVATGPVGYSIATVGGDATAGVDYAGISLADQVIPQGQLAKTHSILINGDTDIEATEVLLVNVRQPTGASIRDGQGTGYILNDDGPTLSIPDASVGEGNNGTKVMYVTVKLSQVAAMPVTFAIATANVSAAAGSDYTALNLANQTIAAGELSKVFQVPVAGDTTVEQNETLTVTLSNPTGASLYDRQAIATIYNDDGPTLSVNDVSIAEGNSGSKVATFTVFLSQAASVPITFTATTSDVTATAGPDYVARSQSFQLAAGQLSKTFTVALNGDTSVEADETFRVTLGNVSAGATLFKYIGTGTITNDD